MALWGGVLLSAELWACSERHLPSGTPHGNPPSPVEASATPVETATPPIGSPLPTGSSSVAPLLGAAPSAVPSAAPKVVASAGTPVAPPETTTSIVPALVDEQGKALPQTDARPVTTSPWFQELGKKLFEAIVTDDPERARAGFFPVVAYEQVKAIEKPARDWKARLWKAFEKNIHDYHRELSGPKESARFLGWEIPEAKAAWMKPGSEGNKLGYWRVLRSHLRYADAAGKEHAFEITSCISWRGEWYVVHLHGFKL